MPDQPASLPKKSSVHGVIIGLLFALLLGTLAVVALLVSGFETKSDDAILVGSGGSCDNEVMAANNACEAQRAADALAFQGQVPARNGVVGFEYPAGWSAIVGINITNGRTWHAQLVPGYFYQCDDCDGPARDIVITVNDKAELNLGTQSFADYVSTQYSSPDNSNVVITPANDDSDQRYTVTGHMDGLRSADFESIYFEGSTDYAVVTFLDLYPTSTATNDGWEIVKESLDFSGI